MFARAVHPAVDWFSRDVNQCIQYHPVSPVSTAQNILSYHSASGSTAFGIGMAEGL